MYVIWMKKEMAGRFGQTAPVSGPSTAVMPAHSSRAISATTSPLSNVADPVRITPGQSRTTSNFSPLTHKPNHKFALIQDTAPSSFRDLVVEVVKIFPSPYGGQTEVYVTDYTSHPLLYDYPSPDETTTAYEREGDRYGYMPTSKREWPGPWGQMVLKVEARDPHAAYVRTSVKEGDCISIRNARIKMSHQDKLEANVYPDSRYPEKILISLVKATASDEAQALIARKDAYWQKRKPRDVNLPKPKSKAQKKREKQQARRGQQPKNVSEIVASGPADVNGNGILKPPLLLNRP